MIFDAFTPLGTIYGLADPRTKNIRYVGQTCIDPERRYRQHMGRYVKWLRLGDWLDSLSALALKPKLVILALCPIDWLQEREQFFIDKYRSELLNTRRAHKTSYIKNFSVWVQDMETGEIYSSYAAAGRACNSAPGSIRNWCEHGTDWRTLTAEQARAMVKAREAKRAQPITEKKK